MEVRTMGIPRPIRIFLARIYWQDLIKRDVIGIICFAIGFIFYAYGGVVGTFKFKSFNSLDFNFWIFIAGVIILVLSVMFFYSKPWIVELPEYKAKKEKERVDKILGEADKLIETIDDNELNRKLRGMSALCGIEEMNLDAVIELEEWLADYKEMIEIQRYRKELVQTEKDIPAKKDSAMERMNQLFEKLKSA